MNRNARVIGLAVLLISIGSANTRADEPEYVPDEVLVKYEEGVGAERIGEIEASHSLDLIEVLPLVFVHHYGTKPGTDIPTLSKVLTALPEVRYAEPNFTRTLSSVNDPLYSDQWALNNTGQTVNYRAGPSDIDIDWPEAMAQFTGSVPVVVAVVDSGVSMTHEDVLPSLWFNPGESPFGKDGKDNDGNGFRDDLVGLDLANRDLQPWDETGHGTLVASLIGSPSGNSLGIAGVCPSAKIMVIRALDGFGVGGPKLLPNVNDSTLGIAYAVGNGARIVNLSYGGSWSSQTERDLFELLGTEYGVLAVAAAGNEHLNNDSTPAYPASYPSEAIISVAAVDRTGYLAQFSNYGEESVDVAAPGTDIVGATVGRAVVYSESFDGDLTGWIVGSEPGNQSTYTWVRDFYGDNGFIFDGSGTAFEGTYYAPNSSIWVRSPAFDLSAYKRTQLEFSAFHKLDFSWLLFSVDLLLIELSSDGTNWVTYNYLFGETSSFADYSVDISDYDYSQSCYVRFRLKTDSIFQRDGVIIDDLRITAWDEFAVKESQYKPDNGTSFSAPIVSGIAAMLMSERPDLTHLQIKDAILESAVKLEGLDGLIGTGAIVNAHKALEAVKALPPRLPEIRRQPGNAAIYLGETVMIDVGIVSPNSSTFQWHKDDVAIQGQTSKQLVINGVSTAQTGTFTCAVTNSAGTTVSQGAVVTIQEKPVAPTIVTHPIAVSLKEGETLRLAVEATGTAPFVYQWYQDSSPVHSASNSVYEVSNASVSDTGRYFCTVRNSVGTVSSNSVQVTVAEVIHPAEITTGPQSVAIYEGGSARLSVTASGSRPITYQWYKGQTALTGETTDTLNISEASRSDTSNYLVRVTNSWGTDQGDCLLTVLKPGTGAPTLANISNRGQVKGGDGVLIPGFVITGTESKRLLIRGIGPALEDFGLNGVLAKPQLTLVRNGTSIVDNSGWGSAVNSMEIDAVGDLLGAFGLTSDKNDCAIFVGLQPGSYTVRLGGEADTEGLGLVEVYDADPGSESRLANLSVRAYVGTGNDILIPGLVVSGNGSARVLIRAVGPTLGDFGVSGVLEDPKLTLMSNSSEIAVNDNWGTTRDLSDLISTTSTVGAFSLGTGSNDAALILALAPGAYTAKVEGVGKTTGVCLVEVYYVE